MMITMNNAYVMITMTRPGKRPMSSMSPTIITDSRGAAKLVIGAHLWIMMIMLVVDERWKIFPDNVDSNIYYDDDDVGDYNLLRRLWWNKDHNIGGARFPLASRESQRFSQQIPIHPILANQINKSTLNSTSEVSLLKLEVAKPAKGFQSVLNF